jgi:hypothetical protein
MSVSKKLSRTTAGEGEVFVCLACGKRSKDRYGSKALDRGWDASCMLNAQLCYESHVVYDQDLGRATAVLEGGVVEFEFKPLK